jgi:HK97 gp10 family phage protein
MAVNIGGEVIGAKELEQALKQLPKATAKGVLRRALSNAAKPTAQAAESLAPRGATGNLQASIEISTRLKKSQKHGKRTGVELFIGATTPQGAHAHLLEFGTAKMSAQPFLRPAWDSTQQQVLESIKSEVWKALAKSARTLARKAERGTLSAAARRALR